MKQRRNMKKMLQKYLLVLFSLALVLSPFSSLGELAYAEGGIDESGNTEVSNEEAGHNNEGTHENRSKDPQDDEQSSEPARAPSTPSEGSTADNDQANPVEGEEAEGNDGSLDTQHTLTGQTDGFNKSEPTIELAPDVSPSVTTPQSDTPNPTAEGFEWKDNEDGTVTITGYTGTETEITTPDQIDGKDVVAIGREAFRNKGLTSVTFGNMVETIGMQAFSGNEIEELTVPSHIKTIGNYSFMTNEMKHVIIVEGVQKIQESVFADNKIKSVIIPESVSSMVDNPFHSNPLETIQISKNNEHSHTINDKGLYTRDGKTLLIGTISAEIEEGITDIGTRAFSGMDISSVVIPKTVLRIYHFAFSGNKLEEIDLPEGLEAIGEVAFYDNELTSLEIPSSMKEVLNFTFGRNNLTSVKFFSLNTVIAPTVFNDNKSNDIIIYGYSGSAAEEFAKDKQFTFKPLDVVESIKVETGETIEIKNASNETIAKLKIPNTVQPANALDNATLKVTMVSPTNKPGEIAGVVLDFTFQDENGNEIAVEGDFELSLFVNDPSQPNLAIFHEEANGAWERIGGTVDGNFITAPVQKFSAYGVFADPLPYTWIDDGSEVTITGYTGTETEITIPDEIDGMPVRVIGREAFYYKHLTKVEIPDGIEVIESSAFSGNKLTSVELPDSVKEIGYSAFVNNQLKSVTLPNGITELGWNSFAQNQIESIEIPKSVTKMENEVFRSNQITEIKIHQNLTEIGSEVFSNNPLEKIVVDPANPNYKGDGNDTGLYSKDGKTLIQGTKSGFIADGTEEIGYRAFYGVGVAGEVMIPDTVKTIQHEAFHFNEITSVEIPDGVETIGYRAFYGNQIKKAVIPSSVNDIRGEAFWQGTDSNEFIILNPDPNANYADRIFNSNEILYGYTGSAAETYARDNQNPFITLVDLNGETTIEVSENSKVAVINEYATIQAKIQIPSSIINIASSNLTVKVKDASGKAPEGLEQAGAVLDISFYDGNRLVTFEDYKDNETYTNDPFTLSLLVDDSNNPKIYHEIAEGNWEEIGGTVADNMITAEVWDFSTYGVFNKVVPPTPVREYRDIEVTKEWKGTPTDSVTVYLVINGERYQDEVAVLNESNNWNYSFFHIEIALDGVGHDITVEEEPVEGYETSISGSAEEGFIVTNTEIDPCDSQDPIAAGCPEDEIEDDDKDKTTVTVEDDDKTTPKKGTLPNTATNTFNLLLIGGILFIIGATTAFVIHRRRNIIRE